MTDIDTWIAYVTSWPEGQEPHEPYAGFVLTRTWRERLPRTPWWAFWRPRRYLIVGTFRRAAAEVARG